MSLRDRLSLLTKLEAKPRTSQPALDCGASLPLDGFELPGEERALSVTVTAADLAFPCGLPQLMQYNWSDIAFFDTETTGLSTGSGTYIFLAGIGSFQDGRFSVRQFFLPSPAREQAFLQAVVDELSCFPVLATFNGKTYDVPLLNSRLTMAGLPGLYPNLQLDLLHPARRLWKRLLKSCALQSLENHRLGVLRDQDIPGALIPERYFQFLEVGDAFGLRPVFQHNRQDIFSLFQLGLHMAEICSSPARSFTRAEEFFALAELHARAGEWRQTVEAIQRGVALPGEGRTKKRFRRMQAMAHYRLGEFDLAALAWEQIAQDEPFSLEPCIELAKLHEHRLRDLRKALQYTERVVAICERRRKVGAPVTAQELAEIEKRRQRLLNKLEKQRPMTNSLR